MFLTTVDVQSQINLANKLTKYWSVFTAGANSYLLGIVCTLLPIISYWYLFEKKDESGWKVLIPFYGSYIQYKLFFNTGKFWRQFFAGIFFVISVFVILFGVALAETNKFVSTQSAFIIMAGFLLGFVSFIWMLVIAIQYDISICKRYGRGFWFIMGMIFFQPIFIGILAYEVFKGRFTEVE